ncbi:MAG: HEAT repeat domain-containing protein [Thermodesulfovibrionales bacterium]
MITFFCPKCWKEIKRGDRKCPHCGADITAHERKSFEEKLINALKHPERETVQRAVWILGRLKSHRAVNPLIRLFEQSDNPYLKREILDALFEIRLDDAMAFIMKSLKSEISIVRKKAEEIIKREGNYV